MSRLFHGMTLGLLSLSTACWGQSHDQSTPLYFGDEMPSCKLHSIQQASDYPNRRPLSEHDQELFNRKQKADKAIAEWEIAERSRLDAIPKNSAGLIAMPLDAETPLGLPPRNPALDNVGLGTSRDKKYQYGSPELVFQIRRAAKYAELMSTKPAPIFMGDLSAESGGTPEGRHRAGAHQFGQHADIYYPSAIKGQATSRAKDVDMETTGWMIYSLMRSPSVALMLTAYKDELAAQARHWFEAGLIEWEALVRIEENLTQDMSENHNEHLHVNATGLDATPSEYKVSDVYKCFNLVKLCQSNMTRTSASWSIIKKRKPASECPAQAPAPGLGLPTIKESTPAEPPQATWPSTSNAENKSVPVAQPPEALRQSPQEEPKAEAEQPTTPPEMIAAPKRHGLPGLWDFWKTRYFEHQHKAAQKRAIKKVTSLLH